MFLKLKPSVFLDTLTDFGSANNPTQWGQHSQDFPKRYIYKALKYFGVMQVRRSEFTCPLDSHKLKKSNYWIEEESNDLIEMLFHNKVISYVSRGADSLESSGWSPG